MSEEQKHMLNSSTPNRTNREKEDLLVPLPNWTASDLKEVVLHDGTISPPCVKVRALLTFYKIRFTRIEGKKKDSDYPGVPVLMVNGRQINDSYIIYKTLSPILAGKPMSPTELEIDELITYGLMPAIEAAVVDSGADLRRCSSLLSWMCCPLWTLSWCLPCLGVSSRIKKDYPGLKELEYYADKLQSYLGSNQFFGGDAVGFNDLALYGMMAPFAKAETETYNQRVLANFPPLRDWHDRMTEVLSLASLF